MFRRQVGEAVEIRQFHVKEADMIFASVDRNRGYLRELLPWVDRAVSAAEIRDFIVHSDVQYEANRSPNCGIWMDGAFIGSIGCHAVDWNNSSCSIGYWIEAGHQGKGVMTSCCEIMLDYLFYDLQLHRVEIRCGAGNHKSCAIPNRLGFTREGMLREAEWVSGRWVDLVVWSMLAAEWRARINS